MPFDFKKEYKDLYAPKTSPSILTIPPVNYIAIEGQGDPNLEAGEYQQAVGVLYAVSYTLKMSHKSTRKIPGFFEYAVPPLEGFWWQPGTSGVDYRDKSSFHWISVIRLPDFVSREDLAWAVEEASRKKKLDCSKARFLSVDEGLCVQLLHIGPYDSEPESIARMDQHLVENGYKTDWTGTRRHHEIYLSDPRRTPPEKWKTVIRHPIVKL